MPMKEEMCGVGELTPVLRAKSPISRVPAN